MSTIPGAMKQIPPSTAPTGPRSRQAQKIASCVDAGPGRRLVVETPSSNSLASIQWRCSTHSRRSSAMCVGGPPKPMQPSRSHSRAMVASETRDADCRPPAGARRATSGRRGGLPQRRPGPLASLRIDRPLQRLEHVAEVLRHRGVARIRIVSRDRRDDRLVLPEGLLGRPGRRMVPYWNRMLCDLSVSSILMATWLSEIFQIRRCSCALSCM